MEGVCEPPTMGGHAWELCIEDSGGCNHSGNTCGFNLRRGDLDVGGTVLAKGEVKATLELDGDTAGGMSAVVHDCGGRVIDRNYSPKAAAKLRRITGRITL